MYIRNPLPTTIELMNKLYRMRLEGKSALQIEKETGHHFTTVYQYVAWLKKHPEFIKPIEGGETK